MDIHEKLHDKLQDEMKLVSKINLKGKTTSLMEEFKSFAFKGNVVDMAIGIIIGAAFGKIVTSMVNDIIMPLVHQGVHGEAIAQGHGVGQHPQAPTPVGRGRLAVQR